MSFDDILAGFKNTWQNNPDRKAELRALANKQTPDTFILTCADSRIDPAGLCGCSPGSLFVARNAGNFIPPASKALKAQGDGMVATLEYAVKALKISHIIVMGHSDCGAMKAVQTGMPIDNLPHVSAWLENSGTCESDLQALTKANVVQQLKHIRSYPFVTQSDIHLHGWYIDFATSEVDAFDAAKGGFVSLQMLYKDGQPG